MRTDFNAIEIYHSKQGTILGKLYLFLTQYSDVYIANFY